MTAAQPDADVPPLRLRVLDTVFRLQPKYRETYEVLRRDWSRCVVEDGGGDGQGDTSADRPHELSGEESPLPEQFGYGLASQLTVAAIDDLAGRAVMLHAAGLADDAGRVVAFVAPSGSGKTTLARALGSAGLGYVTDETVAIMPDGSVLHYPKPLSLLDDPGGSHIKSQHGPDELGLGLAPAALRISRLVLLDRVADPGVEPHLSPVPLIEAVLAVLPQTSAMARRPAPLQELCQLLASCGAWRLTYAEADGVAGVVLGLLDLPVGEVESWFPLPAPSDPTDLGGRAAAAPSSDGVTYQRADVREAVRIGDEAVVLIDRVAVRLGPLGLTVWERCEGGAGIDDLEHAAVVRLGPSPDAGDLVRGAVEAMVAAGVLRQV